MTADKPGLNGSVNLLADAMRRVFTEAVEGAVDPLRTEMKAMRTDMRDMETRLEAKIDARAETTDQNVQAQIADLDGRMQKGFADVNRRIDGVEERRTQGREPE